MPATVTHPKILPLTDRLRQVEQTSRTELCDATTDYFTKYYALHHLRSVAEEDPSFIDDTTVSAIQRLFKNEVFARQRQSLFFYRQASEVLTTILARSCDRAVVARAMISLKEIVASSNGNRHRAAVEAIGSLPTQIRGPQLAYQPISSIPRFDWRNLLDSCAYRCRKSTAMVIGRSLVCALQGDNRLLVLKLAKVDDRADQLVLELDWMNYLHRRRAHFPDFFHIPMSLEPGGARIFKLDSLPVPVPDSIEIHPDLMAIAFLAPEDYFNYPNANDLGNRPDPETFVDIMRTNAFLFARLASLGIVHTAPISLFHNRIQFQRRRDQGRYEWFRAGRLDRWLSSCDYPNLGSTGLRDFEHLISFAGTSQELYRYIGTHLLSLLLVAGSYFRNKSPQERGLQPNGKPVDTRHLFDTKLFQRVIMGILTAYYEGFVGEPTTEDLPLDVYQLTRRLVDEMGVDRYMDEVLRIADQDKMTADAFHRFITRQDYSGRKAVKGAADIIIRTGPHLGAFNQTISIPELIEAVGATAAWCIAGRYWRGKFGGPL